MRRLIFINAPTGHCRNSQQERRGKLSFPSCIAPTKACHSSGRNKRMGPDRSLESRTATVSSVAVTSTQPLLLLSVLLRHTAHDRSTIPQPLPWDPRK
jgi:hypothetical protein